MEVALGADVIILAVPFGVHRDVARAAKNWQGKVVVDARNACGNTWGRLIFQDLVKFG
jgi:predicted dinucleotide-binding enzyme